ncbi:MAG: stage IV sporulation protein A [Lachnospiraceae bacterium]|nr:stage IV sporulation protein A [Lachnospiraceae bacterium]
MDRFNLYKDIQMRTGGEIYLGVVGPVRTGKSTFIKRFMDMMVIPRIDDVHSREQAKDELPQSSAGTVIMTSEPKFIPKTAVEVPIDEQVKVKIRCIDCVGFMVDGAKGHEENGSERLVMTPWYNEPIPFTKAAEIGTRKVIKEHATIGLVVTTDGSFGELSRSQYIPAEEQAVFELKKIGKPFILLLNSAKPYSEETQSLKNSLEEKYHVKCQTMNCDQLRKQDIDLIMQSILYEFPVSNILFYMPGWVDVLPKDHELKEKLVEMSKNLVYSTFSMRDFRENENLLEQPCISKYYVENLNMSNGEIRIHLELNLKYYYEMLSELLQSEIHGEYEFYQLIKSLAEKKSEFDQIAQAVTAVRGQGYGLVSPKAEEVTFDEPKLIRHGSKYGVNIKAYAPSIHMISANIETEIAPIVGTEEQAEDLMRYICSNSKEGAEAMWNTLIFGKSVGQLVEEGMQTKVGRMTDESRMKIQETLQKIMNDSNGGVVFVII